MTIEEAIERLSNRYMVVSMCINSNEARAENEALDMAISALRDQSANDGQMKKALRDNGFETFEQLLTEYQQIRSEQKTPCDVCAYNPPSSCDGKPCCSCPAMSKVE